MSRYGGDEVAYRKVGRAVLDDLEDRRGIKRELRAVAVECPDIYQEIELTIGRLAWEATIKQIDWPWED